MLTPLLPCACCLAQVKDETERVSQIAARNGRIFLYKDAACSQEVSLGGLDIANEEVKHWAMWLALFDEETNGPGLDAEHCICFMGDLETKDVLVEFLGLVPMGRSQDYVT